MSLAVAASVERVKRKLDRANTQAVSSFDLFILNVQRDLVATGASLGTPTADTQDILRKMHGRNRSVLDLLLVDLDGEVLIQQSRVGRLRQDRALNRDLLNRTIRNNQLEVATVGFENYFPYLDMAIPVTNEIELPVAVLMMRVDLNELWSETIGIQVGRNGYVYITDQDGQIVTFQNTRLQEPGILLQDLIGRSPLDIARSGFNLYPGLNREWVLGSAQQLEVLPWFAIVERPVQEFLPPVIAFLTIWLLILLTVATLMVNVSRFTRRRIVQPLGQLQAAVAHLSQGEWAYPVQVVRQDELGELARSFQQMAQQLRESFESLEQSNIQMQKLNEAILNSEEKLNQFLEAVPVGIFVVDAQGKPYYANQRAKQILGQGVVATASARSLSETYRAYRSNSDNIYPNEKHPLVQALAGQTTNIDDVDIHTAGKQRTPVEIWGTPIFDQAGEIVYAIAAFQDISRRRQAERERQQIYDQLEELNLAYERFVPEKFLQLLGKESITDVKMGEAVEREMSILFADICNFTTFAENMTPDDSFQFINSYMRCMEPAVMNHGGFVDKYVGDEIMALFDRSADDAVQAAIAMLQDLKEYNRTRERPDRPPIQIGIGINTGPVILGTVGGQHRSDSTAIGDTVNLASRLERLTRVYRVPLLISHHTFWQLTDVYPYHIRLIDRVAVKGKTKQVSVFEVFNADLPDCREGKRTTRTQFEQGLMLYHLEEYYDALQFFQQCLHFNPQDQVAQRYRILCRSQLDAHGLSISI